MHGVSTHSLCGTGKASRSQIQETRQNGCQLIGVERANAGRTYDLRLDRGLRDWAINRDDGGGAALVIRHCVLRIAHISVRFTVDLLSGEISSAEFIRSKTIYARKRKSVRWS
jgi:hypothetical protein